MFIRTQLAYSHLSDPDQHYTMDTYQLEKGFKLAYPLSRIEFVDYVNWFMDKTGIKVNRDLVTNVSHSNQRYVVETEKGKTFKAKNVVIAVGLTNAAYSPEPFRSFPRNLVTHTALIMLLLPLVLGIL